ncbi:hypothetical protein LY76DRAFT_312035 [Colletotrichum caudatum]|nr:hypothetical protein LY76DRAFT_312035 [Colletotrichum caudatum]
MDGGTRPASYSSHPQISIAFCYFSLFRRLPAYHESACEMHAARVWPYYVSQIPVSFCFVLPMYQGSSYSTVVPRGFAVCSHCLQRPKKEAREETEGAEEALTSHQPESCSFTAYKRKQKVLPEAPPPLPWGGWLYYSSPLASKLRHVKIRTRRATAWNDKHKLQARGSASCHLAQKSPS